MSYRGTNYGRFDKEQSSLTLVTMSGSPILSIDYETINNSTINKNDIIVETAVEEVGNDDCICEIRFHVEEPKEEKDDDKMEVEGEENKQSTAESIYRNIVERAKIGEFAGESIATLLDVNLAVPRGKYTIDFYQRSLRFHGMTFNYNIEYRNITKGFVLPMANESQVSIVLQLNKDKPIYQGQTVYRYIVMQIKKDIVVDIRTKVNPELIDQTPALKELEPSFTGAQFQVFIDLLKRIASIGLVQPGNYFESKAKQPCVKANVKAQPGWLYMLKQSLIFIPKPVLYFRVEDIQSVEFHRTGSNNKQFDLKLSLRDEKKSVEFLGIERPELDALVEYFKTRSVKVKMEQQETVKVIAEGDLDDDESDDEDFVEEEEGDSDSDESDEIGEPGSE